MIRPLATLLVILTLAACQPVHQTQPPEGGIGGTGQAAK